MEQGLFANLPSEIIIEILSRLTVESIIICKLVDKSWLNLLETREFAKAHLSNAIPGLAIIDVKSNLNKIIQFEQGPDLDHNRLHYSTISNFSLPSKYGWIGGSVNGLLFLCNLGGPFVVCICNPITRDYIELDCTRECVYKYNDANVIYGFGATKISGRDYIELDCTRECVYKYNDANVIYGFGATKISGQHKVVLIFQAGSNSCVCHVYTLETNLWRRIPHVSHLKGQTIAVFLNGNLHWLVVDRKDPQQQQISCFDLETERFSAFSSPLPGSNTDYVALCALEGCLCLCDTDHVNGITLWLMKEYGNEKSWTKQFVCRNYYHYHHPDTYPIKVFKDGEILMVLEHMYLLYYSKKEMIYSLLEPEPHPHIGAISHTPSFLSLKSFGLENIRSF